MSYKEIILSKTLDYIRAKKVSSTGRGAITMVDCPYCKQAKSAQVIPAMAQIKCVRCTKAFNLVDLVRSVEDKDMDTDDEIYDYLKTLLNIDVQTNSEEIKIQELFKRYQEYGWALVPCAKSAPIGHTGEKVFTGKEVIQAEWQKKENKNPTEWFFWQSTGLNIGVRTGVVSNLTIIDFDLLSKEDKAALVKESVSEVTKEAIRAKKVIPEAIKAIMGDTLMQESLGGFHLFYSYTPDLRKTAFNYENIHIDIENDGGQVIIPPSYKIGADEEFVLDGVTKKRIVGHAGRKFINESSINPIPEPFLKWLQDKTSKTLRTDVGDSGPIDEKKALSLPEDFKIRDIQGNRNNTMLVLGGIFRKEMNIKQTGLVLNVLNKHLLEQPLPTPEIDHILMNLNSYAICDDTTLASDILSYLKETDTAAKQEIEAAVFGGRTTSENKKRLDKTLLQLINSEKIIKKNSREYKLLQDMDWSDQICNEGVPVNFKVPYFHEYVNFNYGDVILIGGTTKAGKTSLGMNMVKRLVEQGLKPRYIYNESGSRFAATALRLGLKDGDFYKVRCNNPNEVIMKPNSVYIYDWFRPNDFTKTAEMFDTLTDKLEKAKSFMICFAQLRDGNKNDWFAKDQIRQFVAMSAKYLYADNDGVDTYFDVDDVRDSKHGAKRFKITTKYVRETREVLTQEEFDIRYKKDCSPNSEH